MWNDGTESLTISGGAGLALKAEWGSKACAVIEAPALLHLGGAGALRAGVSHWRPPVVHRGRLPVFDALTSGARHPHPLLEAQLLAVEWNGDEQRYRGESEWEEGFGEWRCKEVEWQTDEDMLMMYILGQLIKDFWQNAIVHSRHQSSYRALSSSIRVKGLQDKMEKDQHALQQYSRCFTQNASSGYYNASTVYLCLSVCFHILSASMLLLENLISHSCTIQLHHTII